MVIAVSSLEGVAINMAVTKLLPRFLNYSPDSNVSDDKILREYIRTLNGNVRASISDFRDHLNHLGEMDKWNLLNLTLEKVDDFDSLLRTALTGEAGKKLQSIHNAGNKNLDNLISQDLKIIESVKMIEEMAQNLYEGGQEQDGFEGNCLVINTNISKSIGLFKERRSIINGIPLSIINGETIKKLNFKYLGTAIGIVLTTGGLYLYQNGMLG